MLSSLLKLAFNVVNFVFLDRSREVSLPLAVQLASRVVSSVFADRFIVSKSFTPIVSFAKLVSVLRSTLFKLF